MFDSSVHSLFKRVIGIIVLNIKRAKFQKKGAMVRVVDRSRR
jgi:hypothetical protein